MPTFTYQAKQGPTNLIEGTIEAPSQDEAVSRLLEGGLVPVMIVIKSEDTQTPQRSHQRLSAKERRMFIRQLTSLIRAKVELVPSIGILRDQSPSRAMSRLLEDLERHMRDGNPFSEALSRHPQVFNKLFITAIQAGEAAGKLDEILEKLVEFAEQQELMESRFKSALAYPVLLGIVGMGCLGFFVWFVVPRMASLFTNLGGALPWPTRFLMDASHFLSHDWAWLLGGVGVTGMGLRLLSRVPVVYECMERLTGQLPIAGEVLRARQVGRFTRTLQLLLDSGLPVFQALDVARPTVSSRLQEENLQRVQERVKQGGTISESLREIGCFPPLVHHLIGVGERGGNLTQVLDELARYYERYLDESLRIISSLLEPLMIVLMGLVVGFCVLAMVLPIFQLNQLIR